MRKIFIFLGVLTFLVSVFAAVPQARAMTTDELQALVVSLQAQIAQLQTQLSATQGTTSAAWCHDFNTNLIIGDSGQETAYLSTALLKEGFLIAETNSFTEQVASAVVGFQEKYASEILTPNGLKYGTGVAGPATRAKLNKLYGCSQATPPPVSILTPDSAPTIISQGSSAKDVEEIGQLTNQLLQSGSRSISASEQQSAVEIAKKRKGLLLKLAENNPGLFLTVALKKDAQLSMPAAVQGYLEKEVAVEGKIEALHIDDFQNPSNSKFSYFLKIVNERASLLPVQEISIASGAKVRVQGIQLDKTIVTAADNASFQVLEVAPKPESVGDQKILALLIRFKNSGNQPFTKERAYDMIFNGQAQKFYKEQSYKQVSFSGDVFGWFTLDYDSSRYTGTCDVATDTGLLSNLVQNNAIDLGKYSRLVFVVDIYGGGCSSVGKWEIPISSKTYRLSTAGVGADRYDSLQNYPFQWTAFDDVFSHELGHSLGVVHANAWDCKDQPLYGNCVHIEYGNMFDVMGNGWYSLHFNAFYKELLGWINPSSVLVISNSGTYTINPLESADSTTKLAKIKIQGAELAPFYLEYRKGMGFDVSLNKDFLSSNQLGLFINSITNFISTRLLDMTTTAGASWYEDIKQVTLNGGNIFTDTDRGITIGPIIKADESSITFDVKFASPITIPSITVTSPNGGERWKVGESNRISWASSNVNKVWIKYSDASNNAFLIASLDTNPGYYNWVIPSTLAAGSNYKIEVMDPETAAFDWSNNYFSIEAPIISKVREQINSCFNSISSVWVTRSGIELGYSPRFPVWANTLSEILPREEVKIHLTGNCTLTYNNRIYNLVSGWNTFIWEPVPSLTVTSPNGGEAWITGETRRITWTSSNVSKVLIKYNAGTGSDVQIASLTSNPGYYDWVIPATLATGNNYKIEVVESENGKLLDWSDNYFSIIAPKKISPCGSYGDVNGDGYVTNDDATLVSKYAIGTATLTTDQRIRADVNGDGAVNSGDYLLIGKYIAGTVTTFTACAAAISPSTTASSPPITLDYAVRPIIFLGADTNIDLNSYLAQVNSSFQAVRDWYSQQLGGKTFSLQSALIYRSSLTESQLHSQYGTQTGIWYQGLKDAAKANGLDICDAGKFYYFVSPIDNILGGMVGAENLGCSYILPGTASITGHMGRLIGGIVDQNWQEWWADEIRESQGGVAHEIGHGLGGSCVGANNINGQCNGLPHPIEWDADSIMLEWWLFNAGGKFTDTEKTQILKSPFISSIYTVIPVPSVTVTSPNGGEAWITGETRRITWTSSNVSKVLIKYNAGTGSDVQIASLTSNPGYYDWVIPAALTAGSSYKIEVLDPDSAALDWSNSYFGIAAPTVLPPVTVTPSITVTSPNGGETWEVGKTYDIKWQAVGFASGSTMDVNLFDYSRNVNYRIGTYSAGAQSSVSWTIPSSVLNYAGTVDGSKFKVSVFHSAMSYYNDFSNSYFSIVASTTVASLEAQLASISEAIYKLAEEIKSLFNR